MRYFKYLLEWYKDYGFKTSTATVVIQYSWGLIPQEHSKIYLLGPIAFYRAMAEMEQWRQAARDLKLGKSTHYSNQHHLSTFTVTTKGNN